jgi:hypothetical protein
MGQKWIAENLNQAVSSNEEVCLRSFSHFPLRRKNFYKGIPLALTLQKVFYVATINL